MVSPVSAGMIKAKLKAPETNLSASSYQPNEVSRNAGTTSPSQQMVSPVPENTINALKFEVSETSLSARSYHQSDKLSSNMGTTNSRMMLSPVPAGMIKVKFEAPETGRSYQPGKVSSNLGITKSGQNISPVPDGMINAKFKTPETNLSASFYQPVEVANNITNFGQSVRLKLSNTSTRSCLQSELPQIKGLTSLRYSLPKWLSNAYPVELDERNHPPVRVVESKPLETPSCPKYFDAYVKDPKPTYELCDKIELIITARDCNRTQLTTGGDFIWTWLKTKAVKASQTQDGNVTDIGNGTYIARFTLRWTGTITPVVAVVRSREEMSYLREWRDKTPYRFCYNGIFIDGNRTVTTPCHLTPWMNLTYTNVVINSTRSVCNYTDPSTGMPWFCIKQPNFHCSSYNYSRGDTEREKRYNNSKSYFTASKGFVYVKQITPSTIEVVNNQRPFSTCEANALPSCTFGLPSNRSKTPGFYYKNVWVLLQCSKRKFNKASIAKTLQNKTFHLFGDSTARQWFEYISKVLRDEMCVKHFGATTVGYSTITNSTITFTFHGFPIRGKHSSSAFTDYIPNRLDSLTGGPDVAIVITLWAHFTTTSLEYYSQRLMTVKYAIERLLTNYPGTRIFIKSANTREKGLAMSNWYAWECDQMMRRLLGTMPGVMVIDVWDMTIGHYTGFRVHPREVVVKNEIDMLLSFLG